jgi:hypothetical protein
MKKKIESVIEKNKMAQSKLRILTKGNSVFFFCKIINLRKKQIKVSFFEFISFFFKV